MEMRSRISRKSVRKRTKPKKQHRKGAKGCEGETVMVIREKRISYVMSNDFFPCWPRNELPLSHLWAWARDTVDFFFFFLNSRIESMHLLFDARSCSSRIKFISLSEPLYVMVSSNRTILQQVYFQSVLIPLLARSLSLNFGIDAVLVYLRYFDDETFWD